MTGALKLIRALEETGAAEVDWIYEGEEHLANMGRVGDRAPAVEGRTHSLPGDRLPGLT